MLAKKFRLTGNNDFLNVQKQGTVFQSANFGVAIFDRKDDSEPRFGFVVSTKIAKDAVDRNTIKRHMSETVRLMTNDIKRGLDIVFLAKTGIMKIPADELIREVRASVRESGLIIN